MHIADKNASVETQVVFKPQATGNITYNNYPVLQSKINGGLQILIGALLAVVIGSIELYYMLAVYGVLAFLKVVYFVCGVWFIAAGSLGISAGREKTKYRILAFMILSLIATVFVAIGFLLDATSGVKFPDSVYLRLGDSICDEGTERYDENACHHAGKVVAGLAYSRLVLFILEAGVVIWASILCCRAMCCGAHEQVTGVLYTKCSTTGGSAPNQA